MISLLLTVLVSVTAHAGIVEEVAALNAHRSLRGPDNAPPISAQVYEKALSGPMSGIQAVEGVNAAQAWGVAVFNLPIEQVWQGLISENEHAGTAAPVSVSKLVGGKPYMDGRLLFQFMPLPLVSDRWWVVRLKHNKQLYEASQGKMWEVHWTDENKTDHLKGTPLEATAADGMPVAWTKGAWLLIQLSDQRTLVEYYAWSDPGGRLPAGPASRFAGGAVKDTLRSMEAFCATMKNRSRAAYVRPDGSPL
jgi:hypothetical protein